MIRKLVRNYTYEKLRTHYPNRYYYFILAFGWNLFLSLAIGFIILFTRYLSSGSFVDFVAISLIATLGSLIAFRAIFYLYYGLDILYYDRLTDKRNEQLSIALDHDDEEYSIFELLKLLTVQHEKITRDRALINFEILTIIKSIIKPDRFDEIEILLGFYQSRFAYMKNEKWKNQSLSDQSDHLRRLFFVQSKGEEKIWKTITLEMERAIFILKGYCNEKD